MGDTSRRVSCSIVGAKRKYDPNAVVAYPDYLLDASSSIGALTLQPYVLSTRHSHE